MEIGKHIFDWVKALFWLRNHEVLIADQRQNIFHNRPDAKLALKQYEKEDRECQTKRARQIDWHNYHPLS